MILNKIICTDCEGFLKKIENNFVDLIVIDPPYNELPKDWDNFTKWNLLKTEFNRVLKDNGQVYIFGKQPMLADLYSEFKDLFDFRFELIWNKSKGFWASNYMPMKSHELIWCFKKKKTKVSNLYFDINSIKTEGEPYVRKNKVISTVRNGWKKNHTIYKDGKRFPLSVLNHSSISSKNKLEGTIHPTQKPLMIIDWIIKSSSKKNDIILDCFMGSGTTAVSCKKLGRQFLGCDNEERYVDLANERLKQIK